MAITITQLLQTLMQQKGSDLHVAANSPPMIRVRGDMLKIDIPPLTATDVEGLVNQMTSAQQKSEIATVKGCDFAFKAQGIGVFRVNVFTQRHGLGIVVRALAENPPDLEDLNLPGICKTACNLANGLVLVTGPTGSGKSTTLAAMINYINRTSKGHILTLEDPIEFQHESKMCMVNQRSLGGHFPTFAAALKAALREDPDVILVGEMRDPETMELAITAAETGHLVFSTMHTNSAAKAVDRIIDSFPAEEQNQIRTILSETLRVVISQKLIPSADRKRRIAIHDILVNTPAVANLIREGKTFQLGSVMQTGKSVGMQQFDRVLLELAQRGEVDGGTAFEYCNDKALFVSFDPNRAAAQVEVNGRMTNNTPAGQQASPQNAQPPRPGMPQTQPATGAPATSNANTAPPTPPNLKKTG